MNKFGSKLEYARKFRGLTVRDVAKETGVSIAHISRIENNKATPNVHLAIKLADLYEMDFDDIFYPSCNN